jgi:superfamily II DNA or RNA helicase
LKMILSNKLVLREVPAELHQLLIKRLEIPNPKWIENERMGRWNGNTPQTLNFYEQEPQGGLIIPRGYIRKLILSCRHRNITYELIDNRRKLASVDFNFHGSLRPYQQNAVKKLLSKDFGTLSFPTGSGKTVVGLYMIANRKQPSMVVVHTRDLAFQWMEKVTEFLNIPADEIGMIGGGETRVGDRITLAMVQTLYKCAVSVSQKIGFLLVDECHRAPSRTFTEAVTAFDSKYMLGLSATPWRRDKLSKLIFWHLGDLHYKLESAELIKSGDVLEAEVIVRETNFRPYHDASVEYTQMIAELIADDDRNRMIAEDVAKEARDHPGVSLVLSDRKAHCETLKALLKYRHHIIAELLTGDLSPLERQNVLERLKRGEFKVLIATGQLMGEGFDCKDLTTLFLTTPIRFKGRVLQYLGRVLRPAPKKKAARVFDYVDIHVEPLKASARERLGVYQFRSENKNIE